MNRNFFIKQEMVDRTLSNGSEEEAHIIESKLGLYEICTITGVIVL